MTDCDRAPGQPGAPRAQLGLTTSISSTTTSLRRVSHSALSHGTTQTAAHPAALAIQQVLIAATLPTALPRVQAGQPGSSQTTPPLHPVLLAHLARGHPNNQQSAIIPNPQTATLQPVLTLVRPGTVRRAPPARTRQVPHGVPRRALACWSSRDRTPRQRRRVRTRQVWTTAAVPVAHDLRPVRHGSARERGWQAQRAPQAREGGGGGRIDGQAA